MSSLSQNVSLIIAKVPGMTPAQCLVYIQEALNLAYGDCEQTCGYDPATGMPPYLVTTAGTFEYDCPADCKRVRAVFYEGRTPYGTYGLNERYGLNKPRDQYYYFQRREYQKVNVRTIDATYDEVAKVIFTADPGTSTTRYFLHYYKKPPEIGTLDDSLPFPDDAHYVFRKLVLTMYRTEEYGDTQGSDAVIKDCLRTLRNKLNSGYQGGHVGFTPDKYAE